MAPMLHFLRRAFDPGVPSGEFREQFTNPTDVFSVLLILGGDVVARALAQLAGSRITPVAFSFGWVAYAMTAVLSAISGDSLMPAADYPCKVINAHNGFVRDNNSWILGRVLRDFEKWMDNQPRAQNPNAENNAPEAKDAVIQDPVRTCVKEIIDASWENLKRRAKEKGKTEPERPPKAGLCVPIYRAKKATKGYPGYDAPYIAGFITCVLQLGIAAIPCGIFGDWSILLITAAGMILAFISGALPQWSKEKWACREDSEKTFVLTRGNGSQYAVIIQGAGLGFDLEDLAAADGGTTTSWSIKLAIFSLATLWTFLLIGASGISEKTWFLLAVGGLGILQNTYVVGASRSPEAFGMPLEFVEVIGKPKVMDTLFEVEERYPRVGKNLLPIFSGELNEMEKEKWKGYEDKIAREKLEKKNKP